MALTNRQITLASRPVGEPTPENFRLVSTPVPTLGENQVLLKTMMLSLDPYMRGRMSDEPSYAPPVNLGEVMCGGTVSQVMESRSSAFQKGDLVVAYSGWQEYEVANGKGLTKIDPALKHPSFALGVLGMPGMTAYMGLLDIGQPKAGETIVVAAATGPVGSIVGQIGKLKGCHVVGVAGGKDKCRAAVEEFGFDICLDHRDKDLAKQLKVACPKGVDVYFENVGGHVFDAVLPLFNTSARMPLCGLAASYNATSLPAGPDRTPAIMSLLLKKRMRVQGFIVSLDYGPRYGEFAKDMVPWVQSGKVKTKEDFVDGLENAPQAFIGQLTGKNFGKLIVRVAAL